MWRLEKEDSKNAREDQSFIERSPQRHSACVATTIDEWLMSRKPQKELLEKIQTINQLLNAGSRNKRQTQQNLLLL